MFYGTNWIPVYSRHKSGSREVCCLMVQTGYLSIPDTNLVPRRCVVLWYKLDTCLFQTQIWFQGGMLSYGTNWIPVYSRHKSGSKEVCCLMVQTGYLSIPDTNLVPRRCVVLWYKLDNSELYSLIIYFSEWLECFTPGI